MDWHDAPSAQGGTDTPPRPPPPPPTVVRRVGGGFAYERGEHYTEAVAEQAAYEAYRALPPDGGQHTATDVALLAEILREAEAEADAAAPAGGQLQARACQPLLNDHDMVARCILCLCAHNSCVPPCLAPTPYQHTHPLHVAQAVALSRVLRAYERVLRAAGLDPAADTRFYRTLLRLSLDAGEACWWGRLYRETASNCRWVQGRGAGAAAQASRVWLAALDLSPRTAP